MLQMLNERTKHLKVPPRMRTLPISPKGYVTPWFVCWLDEDGNEAPPGRGEPDFRCIGAGRIQKAVREDLCWLCGQRMGVYKTFVIGPMCTVNRVTAEPGCHKACAKYAVQACPFLTQPKMVRNAKELPEHDLPPGEMIKRNPGVTALWTCLTFTIEDGLFHLGPPQNVDWWAQGKRATRLQVQDAIVSGLPLLAERCADADDAAELGRCVRNAMQFLPPP